MEVKFNSSNEKYAKTIEMLTAILRKAKEMIVDLNSSSMQIESAAQEQTSATSEHASGITEVSATLEELSITARQITKNVEELVLSNEEIKKLLDESEKQLLHTVSQLDEVGKISSKNSSEITELGKRSVLINEMVKIIKEIANKTKMLSINAAIEAARNKETGAGFSVIATEIGELSQESIGSAKKVELAAREIQNFLSSIIKSSETESKKVIESAQTAKNIHDNMETIVGKIKNNFTFTQKIDVSIKQQEYGSRQAADTMKQMAEISRQSAETARQTSASINNIVKFSAELDNLVNSYDPEEAESPREDLIAKEKKPPEKETEHFNTNKNKEKPAAIQLSVHDERILDPGNYLQPVINAIGIFMFKKLPIYTLNLFDRIVKLFALISEKLLKIKNIKLHNKKI